MPWRIDHYKKFPFTASPRDFPHLFITSPSTVVAESTDLLSKLVETVRNILQTGEVPVDSYSNYEESILVYYSLLEVAKFLEDKRFTARVALAYSKTAKKQLESEDDEVLATIATKLGLRVVLSHEAPRIPVVTSRGKKEVLGFKQLRYALPVEDYLEVVSKRLAHDEAYSLSNMVVSRGLVYLDNQVFTRILEEKVFQVVLGSAEEQLESPVAGVEKIARVLQEAVLKEYYKEPATIATTTTEREPEEASTAPVTETSEVIESLFPPCIKRILNELKAGGNPSHVERFNLAAFLGQIGLGVDDILEYFKKTADYNEKIARYQVEHILGLRGSRRKYMPYNCDKMKSAGICPIEDQCPGGKNPVAVYKYAVRTLRRRKPVEATEAPPHEEYETTRSSDNQPSE